MLMIMMMMMMMMRYIPIIMIICVDIVYANSVKKIKTIAVIGGGAAGYFSAIQCANIIESNENRYTTTIDSLQLLDNTTLFNSTL